MNILADMDAALAAPVVPVAVDPLADLDALLGLRPVPRAAKAAARQMHAPVPVARPVPVPVPVVVARPVEEPALSQGEMRRQLAARAKADLARMDWPDRWWDGFDCGDAAACRALWASVLAESLRDAARSVAGLSRLPQGVPAGAESWVDSRDFHMVAALAGFDGVALADRLRPVLADPALAARLDGRLMAGAVSGRARGAAA
jgi:hypothetical protein